MRRMSWMWSMALVGCATGLEATAPVEAPMAEEAVADEVGEGWARPETPALDDVVASKPIPARSARGDVAQDKRDEGVQRENAEVEAGPLRAGSTDDNADMAGFLSYLASWTERDGMAGAYDRLDVRDVGAVQVVDAAGVPVAGAEVALRAGDRVVHTARTLGDGRAALYPHLAVNGEAPQPDGAYTVTVRHGGTMRDAAWTAGALTVTLPEAVPLPAAVPIDVAFVLDTTGSMADEIDRIKQTLLTTTDRLQRLGRPVDLRLGAVLYRDRGDAYVTQHEPLTSDLVAFDGALRGVSAGGGGDTPESLNQGLAEAVNGLAWREGAAKVAFLIADAPPHMDYAQDHTYGHGAMDALARGIRVHTVAASGLDPVGSLVFRQVAQLTQGRFIFIQYGSMVASAAAHGVSGEQLASNNLDQILFDRIRDEVLDWRKR